MADQTSERPARLFASSSSSPSSSPSTSAFATSSIPMPLAPSRSRPAIVVGSPDRAACFVSRSNSSSGYADGINAPEKAGVGKAEDANVEDVPTDWYAAGVEVDGGVCVSMPTTKSVKSNDPLRSVGTGSYGASRCVGSDKGGCWVVEWYETGDVPAGWDDSWGWPYREGDMDDPSGWPPPLTYPTDDELDAADGLNSTEAEPELSDPVEL